MHRDVTNTQYVRGPLGLFPRFRPEFDYYSLGLVVLEIGLWTPLRRMTEKYRERTPQELRDKFLGSGLPKLGTRMGTIYQGAVESCLKGEFEDAHAEFTSMALSLSFNGRVVDQLAKCNT